MRRHLHRRRFLQAAAIVLAPAAACADEPAAPTPARALADLVRARFGRDLTAAQLDAAREAIDDQLYAAAAVRRITLDDAEEPAVVFVAAPEE